MSLDGKTGSNLVNLDGKSDSSNITLVGGSNISVIKIPLIHILLMLSQQVVNI